MRERTTQFSALLSALEQAGFQPDADFDLEEIRVNVIPALGDEAFFEFVFEFDDPESEEYVTLLDGVSLAHDVITQELIMEGGFACIEDAMNRAKQEKHAIMISLHRAGISPVVPCEHWQDVLL